LKTVNEELSDPLSIINSPSSIIMKRRKFVQLLSQGLIGTTLLPKLARADHPQDKQRLQFVFAQIRYRGGDWNPHPLSVTPLMEELMARTSVEAPRCAMRSVLTDRDLLIIRFSTWPGKYEFDPFSGEETENLRRFLSYGGFLLIDDALGQQGFGFDKRCAARCKKFFRPTNSNACLPVTPR
jgi:hypothetical protein